MSGLVYCWGPIATYNTQGKSCLLCDWADCAGTEYCIYKVCVLEVLNWPCLYRSNVLWMNVPWTDGLTLPRAAGLLLPVNLLTYRAICSLKPADLYCWSGSSNVLLSILFTKRFSYLSKKRSVDWTLTLIILVECTQLAFADWALLLYYTYNPILVMFF